MKILERLPRIGGKIAGAKAGIVAMLLKSVDSQYGKARKNFEVLAMGIESGFVIEKVARNCGRFVRDNRKESEFSDEVCGELEAVLGRAEKGLYRKSDTVWLREAFLPYFDDRKQALKLRVLSKTLR